MPGGSDRLSFGPLISANACSSQQVFPAFRYLGVASVSALLSALPAAANVDRMSADVARFTDGTLYFL